MEAARAQENDFAELAVGFAETERRQLVHLKTAGANGPWNSATKAHVDHPTDSRDERAAS